MEKGEIIRQIKAIRWKDFYPQFGQISPTSGFSLGGRTAVRPYTRNLGQPTFETVSALRPYRHLLRI